MIFELNKRTGVATGDFVPLQASNVMCRIAHRSSFAWLKSGWLQLQHLTVNALYAVSHEGNVPMYICCVTFNRKKDSLMPIKN